MDGCSVLDYISIYLEIHGEPKVISSYELKYCCIKCANLNPYVHSMEDYGGESFNGVCDICGKYSIIGYVVGKYHHPERRK